MSIEKICRYLCCCQKDMSVAPVQLPPPIHTAPLPITINFAPKTHHKYTSTEVDIHEALRTPEINGPCNE